MLLIRVTVKTGGYFWGVFFRFWANVKVGLKVTAMMEFFSCYDNIYSCYSSIFGSVAQISRTDKVFFVQMSCIH